MSGTQTLAQLGVGELRDQRHVCALFDGPADADITLLPFILDGLAQRDRVVLIVDSRGRDDHLRILEHAGIDTRAALDGGTLTVETWDETYLRGGRFDPTAMVAFVRALLADGRALGFARSRLIGFMEWTLEDVPGVTRIIDYEARVEAALRGLPDLIVCAYDIRRHSQSLILETIVTHPIALIGGVLRPGAGQPASPRERILAAASELFTRHGAGATGVDALIAEARVAKATFYRHFPSKDDLIVAWLRDPRTRWLDRLRIDAQERAGSPEEVIPAFFDAVAEWLQGEGARGCPYLVAAMAMPDLAAPARSVIVDYLAEVEAFLRDRLVEAGHADADVLARQLQSLLAGGITLSAGVGNNGPALAARDAASTLLGRARAS